MISNASGVFCDTGLVIKKCFLTTTINSENLIQCESKFSLIVEQTLAFASSTSLEREVQLYNNVLHYT